MKKILLIIGVIVLLAVSATPVFAKLTGSALADRITEMDGRGTVGLVQKDTNWQVIESAPVSWVKYSLSGKELKVNVHLKGLDPNKLYQLCLNGDGNYPRTNSNLASVYTGNEGYPAGTPKPWISGLSGGNQGYYNFAVQVQPNKKGEIKGHYKVDLPADRYHGVKFLVKEDNYPNPSWWAYPTILFEYDVIHFRVNQHVADDDDDDDHDDDD